MKTHCVRADSSQALTSDIRSFVFLTDSFESQGSRIPYLLCILSVRSSWIFLIFPTAEVPFAIPHKGKNQGNFTGKYCTGLMFGSDSCSDCSWPDPVHQYRLSGSSPSMPLKLPAVFALWGITKGISGLSNRKTEVRRVFGCDFQKRGTGNSDSVPWVKINHEDWESAKSRIYSGLTRMRSDRARRRSWRWFPVFYLSKLIPESSEFPVPLFWKSHPKTLRTSAFLFLSPEIPFANPHKAKGKGHFNGGDGRWSRQ